ncbi:class I SAM-dependent methyltransferase [Chryseosolibacter indicus]|uniref:Methyltransferase domain-containing protein n=1 Tax=Chryseosolibacter indicus TaxID=2782351 RepID=A0ABS5VM11_9BACT|nr:class I SAM-dependent methyltransferase [Chryseosolibacter indicus]MBT1702489.1 methyltransferase domain-containing protein [Chryseosolibacter indicus]
MEPLLTGKKYDKIAHWWSSTHIHSEYGLAQVKRAIRYCKNHGTALDVGCGSGGRITTELLKEGFKITGIDVSESMISIAKANHPDVDFVVGDICTWQSEKKYDLIVAWDSLFHLPFKMHVPVLTKLCNMLERGGILIHTFGDDYGEHESDWHNDKFYYSTIGIEGNQKVIIDNDCLCRHLELDQYPLSHVYMIAQRK